MKKYLLVWHLYDERSVVPFDSTSTIIEAADGADLKHEISVAEARLMDDNESDSKIILHQILPL